MKPKKSKEKSPEIIKGSLKITLSEMGESWNSILADPEEIARDNGRGRIYSTDKDWKVRGKVDYKTGEFELKAVKK